MEKLKALVLDKRLVADYETGVQHGAGRVSGLVPAGAAPRLHEGYERVTGIPGSTRAQAVIDHCPHVGDSQAAAEAPDNGLLAPELAGVLILAPFQKGPSPIISPGVDGVRDKIDKMVVTIKNGRASRWREFGWDWMVPLEQPDRAEIGTVRGFMLFGTT